MKTIALAAAAILALYATATSAQTEPAAHRRELAQELMSEIQFDKMMGTINRSVEQSMTATIQAGASKPEKARMEAMLSASREEMAVLTPKLKSYMVDIYASELTEKELEDTVAFYKTDSGRSILAKLPVLTQRMTPFMQQQMPAVMAGMFRRYCSKVTCSAEEKAAMTKLSGAGS